MGQKGGFKNIKLGKNVHRQIKRRGEPANLPGQRQYPRLPKKSGKEN